MAKLVDVLAEYGCDMDAQEFRHLVIGHFKATHGQYWSQEQLLIRPRWSLVFCDEARSKAKSLYLPDHVILGTLINVRKNGIGD